MMAEKLTTQEVEMLQMPIYVSRAALRAGIEAEEQARWQEAIRELLVRYHPDVDGSGCESGDPLDVTLAEINMTLIHMQNKIDVLEGARP